MGYMKDLAICLAEQSHAEYPHEPGRLYGCVACEFGPCQCQSNDDQCVSDYCKNEGF